MESAAASRWLSPWSLSLAIGQLVDQALLALMNAPSAHPKAADLDRLALEIAGAHRLYQSRNLLGSLEGFHRALAPLLSLKPSSAGLWPRRSEWLSFPSAYAPDPADPVGARWLAYEKNRTAHAWVLRHPDPSRPWLVCLHGMGAGYPLLDAPAFRAQALHELGLNLLFPVLPLHGPRQAPGKGFKAFLSFDLVEAVHGFAQAISEVRGLIGWARAEGATRVGLYGLSLGAYTASVVATLEDVDLVIAGMPISDFLDVFLWHAPRSLRAEVESRGLFGSELRELFRLVSPLALPPRVPRNRRFIFAGLVDCMVPRVQAERLWNHWEQPAISWYAGGHVSFFWTSAVQRFVREALLESGFASGA